MIYFFQWKEKWETVASEKEPSFGASEEKAGGSDDKGKAKQNTENKARDKSDGETPKKQSHLSAAELFSDRYPDYFADLNNLRSKTESRIVLSVLSIVALGVIVAWIFWQEQYFRTDGDLVYYMGLTGGILLLIAALYALRKRVKLFSKIGNMATWYYIHLTAGVIGPVLIIFHTSFLFTRVPKLWTGSNHKTNAQNMKHHDTPSANLQKNTKCSNRYNCCNNNIVDP